MKFLVEEMTHSLPSIAPMGLVQVNIQLIPTVYFSNRIIFLSLKLLNGFHELDLNYLDLLQLIGTTLTYLIILCQFHSSENVK